MRIVRRRLEIALPAGRSVFLWGPRKVGKTYWIHQHFLTGQSRLRSMSRVHDSDLRGLRALCENHRVKHAVLVCLEREPRRVDPKIEILPWRRFLDRLWAGDLLG